MGKYTFVLIVIGCFSCLPLGTNAQERKPLEVRKVSGIVLDSTQQGIIGAIVVLTSKTDTLRTATNGDGLFFFKDVRAWEFTLSVRSLGYSGFVRPGKYNDAQSVLTMDPIILKEQPMALSEVVIDGTPSITYKVDTVEYKAADYKVREGANVGELLKKMEGMEVDRNGKLYYNGTLVAGARLNGKDFIDGQVSTVTKNLPAEIVSKVQIINDYGDQAARTGIKDGLSQQILNITTKADRSLGYFAKIDGEAGSGSRYNGGMTGVQINANRNFALAGHMSNTVTGIPANFAGIIGNNATLSGSPGNGTTADQTAGFSYRDQWGRKMQANMNYSYDSKDVNAATSSVYHDLSTTGITISDDKGSRLAHSTGHRFRFDMEDHLDSLNFLKVSTVASYSSVNSEDQSQNELSGLIRQYQKHSNSNLNATPSYAIEALYQHYFRKKGRNFTAKLSASTRNHNQDQDLNSTVSYLDKITNATLKDSIIRRSIDRRYLTNTGQASVTYSEPLGRNSELQFLGVATMNRYDNKVFAIHVDVSGVPDVADSLSNLFRYTYSHGRLALRYRYVKKRYDISLGAAAVPVLLGGSNLSTPSDFRNLSFNFQPVFRLQYSWNLQQQIAMTYSGNPIEPLLNQVQPVRDVTNPQRPIVGNPNLKTAFIHSIHSKYNNYYPNARVGLNAGLNVGFYQNKVISNVTQIADAYNSLIYETNYINSNRASFVRGNFRLSKQFSDRQYGVSFSGTADLDRHISRSNNVHNVLDQWMFENEIKLTVHPSNNFQINPSLSYAHTFSDNTLLTMYDTKVSIFSLKADGSMYLMKSWILGYEVSRHFISGINSSFNDNPLILNSYVEREFFKKKSLKVRFEIFDMFNQNRFISRTYSGSGFTDSQTSTQNRYFMIGIVGNLQKWKGTPSRNGQTLRRMGDGSFIYR